MKLAKIKPKQKTTENKAFTFNYTISNYDISIIKTSF